jgi:hypothetical protein
LTLTPDEAVAFPLTYPLTLADELHVAIQGARDADAARPEPIKVWRHRPTGEIRSGVPRHGGRRTLTATGRGGGCARMPTSDPGLTDERILRLLVTNARASCVTIGPEVNLSANAVAERVKRLESAGWVRGYTVLLDPALNLTAGVFRR